MSTETITASDRLVVVAPNTQALIDLLPANPNRVVSRVVLKAPGADVVRIALGAGHGLDPHQAASAVLIQVVAGAVVIEADGKTVPLAVGGLICLGPRVRHAVRAETPSELLLTLLNGRTPRIHAPAEGQADSAVEASRGPIGDHLVLASDGADSVALAAITRRHAEISGALAAHVSRLLDAASSADAAVLRDARDRLSGWAQAEVLPLLSAEATVLYPEVGRAVPEPAGVTETLHEGRARVGSLVEDVRRQTDPALAAAAAVALRVVVGHQLSLEREKLLPVLAASRRHSLAELWADVERIVLNPNADADADPNANADPDADSSEALCACGVLTDPELPELDVRSVPHAIRHATVHQDGDAAVQ